MLQTLGRPRLEVSFFAENALVKRPHVIEVGLKGGEVVGGLVPVEGRHFLSVQEGGRNCTSNHACGFGDPGLRSTDCSGDVGFGRGEVVGTWTGLRG